MADDIIIVSIGVLGSIASIWGAYEAIQARRKAITAAQRAEAARDSILSKQKTTDLSEILFEAGNSRQIFAKYNIPKSGRGLTGINFSDDVQSFQNFIFQFNDNKLIIEQIEGFDSELTYKEMNRLLGNFSNSKTNDEKRDVAIQIRVLLDDIIFKLKNAIDERNGKIDS